MQVDDPAVWSELGHAQLDNGLVAEAIASYMRSNDTSRSSDVIERSKEVGHMTHSILSCNNHASTAQVQHKLITSSAAELGLSACVLQARLYLPLLTAVPLATVASSIDCCNFHEIYGMCPFADGQFCACAGWQL